MSSLHHERCTSALGPSSRPFQLRPDLIPASSDQQRSLTSRSTQQAGLLGLSPSVSSLQTPSLSSLPHLFIRGHRTFWTPVSEEGRATGRKYRVFSGLAIYLSKHVQYYQPQLRPQPQCAHSGTGSLGPASGHARGRLSSKDGGWRMEASGHLGKGRLLPASVPLPAPRLLCTPPHLPLQGVGDSTLHRFSWHLNADMAPRSEWRRGRFAVRGSLTRTHAGATWAGSIHNFYR